MSTYFLSVDRIKAPKTILVAARHNLREIQAEIGADCGIDATRIALNRVLMDTPTKADAVADLDAKIRRTAKPQQANGVRAVEVLVGLHHDVAIDKDAFFDQSVRWLMDRYGVPLLSAVTHYDEAQPHAHALFLPLLGGKWIGSDLIGGKPQLAALQADFHRGIASAFGMTYRPGIVGRQTTQAKARIDGDIFDSMFAHTAEPPTGERRSEVMRAIGSNRNRLAKVYGVNTRSFAEIMATPQACT